MGSRTDFGLEQSPSSFKVGLTFDDTESEVDVPGRVFNVYFESDFGTIFLGQGSVASDGTTMSDVAGTTVIGKVGVQDLAGLLALRNSSERLRKLCNQFHGLGRKGCVRYDTPELGGVAFGVSAASDARFDVALKWAVEVDNGVEASAHSADLGDNSDEDFQYGGSFSVGIQAFSFTAAAAQDAKGERDPF